MRDKIKVMRKILVGLFVLVASVTVNADPWSGKTKITTIYPSVDKLTFTSEYNNTEISACDNGHRFSIPMSHPNYDVLASSLISAFMADKSINFNIDSRQDLNCSPTINRLYVYKN